MIDFWGRPKKLIVTIDIAYMVETYNCRLGPLLEEVNKMYKRLEKYNY